MRILLADILQQGSKFHYIFLKPNNKKLPNYSYYAFILIKYKHLSKFVENLFTFVSNLSNYLFFLFYIMFFCMF